jgi:hypothetical protein
MVTDGVHGRGCSVGHRIAGRCQHFSDVARGRLRVRWVPAAAGPFTILLHLIALRSHVSRRPQLFSNYYQKVLIVKNRNFTLTCVSAKPGSKLRRPGLKT